MITHREIPLDFTKDGHIMDMEVIIGRASSKKRPGFATERVAAKDNLLFEEKTISKKHAALFISHPLGASLGALPDVSIGDLGSQYGVVVRGKVLKDTDAAVSLGDGAIFGLVNTKRRSSGSSPSEYLSLDDCKMVCKIKLHEDRIEFKVVKLENKLVSDHDLEDQESLEQSLSDVELSQQNDEIEVERADEDEGVEEGDSVDYLIDSLDAVEGAVEDTDNDDVVVNLEFDATSSNDSELCESSDQEYEVEEVQNPVAVEELSLCTQDSILSDEVPETSNEIEAILIQDNREGDDEDTSYDNELIKDDSRDDYGEEEKNDDDDDYDDDDDDVIVCEEEENYDDEEEITSNENDEGVISSTQAFQFYGDDDEQFDDDDGCIIRKRSFDFDFDDTELLDDEENDLEVESMETVEPQTKKRKIESAPVLGNKLKAKYIALGALLGSTLTFGSLVAIGKSAAKL